METENKDVQVTDNKVEKETTIKTYTEQDIQNSFNAGVKKANSDWQKDEKYKEFLDWKKNNQNDSEKLTQLQASNEELLKENKLLKATNEVVKTNVKTEFLKFVTSEVMEMVNDDTSFETALKSYKEKHPQFFGDVVIKKVQSSPTLNGGGNQATTTNDIMNNILRGATENN